MGEIVIALSGGIGAGKADLGKALASALDADRVSFGAEVRRSARESGADPDDVEVLQHLGQSMVLGDPRGFVDRVLTQRSRIGHRMVVEGVRHVEILLTLKDATKGTPFRLVHVDTPIQVRRARLCSRGASPRLAARYEADVNEEQSARIVPQYADLRIDGGLPIPLQVARIVAFLGPDVARSAGAVQ